MSGRKKKRNRQKKGIIAVAVLFVIATAVVWIAVLTINKGKAGTDETPTGQPEAVTPIAEAKNPVAEVTQVPAEIPEATPTAAVTQEATAVPEPTPILEKLYFLSSEIIPVISVKTEEEQPIVSRDEYVNCTVTVGNVELAHEIRDAVAGIRVRGNSSAYYGDEEKILANEVPYRIKFEKKTNLMGLNGGAKCKSWVLLRADEGLVRDDIAFRLGRVLLGEEYYCSDARLVHLYVNEQFKGVYLLCEQSQVNKHRIDIYEPDAGETGTDIGYLLEIDNYADADEHPFFRMNYENLTLTDLQGVTQRITYANYSVKSEVTSEEQSQFIASYMKDLFRLVYEACENNNYLTFDSEYRLVPAEFTNAQDTIEAVIDTDSVAAMYILYEIMHDMDRGEGSFYMCIDFSEGSKYPKLTFVCPWDFDWTCQGNAKGQYHAAAFDAPEFVEKYGDRSNPWFLLLAKQGWFMEQVSDRWSALQAEGLIAACITEERAYMEAYKADLNRKKSFATATGDAVLDWIEQRVEWLDEEWLR